LEEVEGDVVGLGVEVQLGLQKTVFVLVVEQLSHTGEDCPVFRQNVLTVVHP